jgi:hypothetical protein
MPLVACSCVIEPAYPLAAFILFAISDWMHCNIPAVGAPSHEILCFGKPAVCQSEHTQDI